MKSIQIIRTPTGPLSLIATTAAKLLKEGVISGELDGDLHANDAATVKAAILASSVCDFCSTPGATHYYDVPDFGVTQNDVPFNYSPNKSVGGWSACDECDAIIKANKRQALVERAMKTHAFPKFSKRAIEELYEKFWDGMDEAATGLAVGNIVVGFVEDKLPDTLKIVPELSARSRRLEVVCKLTGMTPKQVDDLTRGKVDREGLQKLAAWKKRFGSAADKELIDSLLNRKPLPDIVPHWQRALDMRFAALANVSAALSAGRQEFAFNEAIDVNDMAAIKRLAGIAAAREKMLALGFETDAKALRVAQTYSFNAETIAAIREAAKGIPHDAPLSSVETPNTGAGWFWFAEPMLIAASPVASDSVCGLLWSWYDASDVGPSLIFSAYVMDDKKRIEPFKKGAPLPSTRWHWPFSMTFHDMIAFNRNEWRKTYGKGGAYEDDPNVSGEEPTMLAVAELSLFFLMACLWFKQTVQTPPVLTREAGHVERHARKRLVKEHRLTEQPTVQVVALRKSARVPAERAEGGEQEARVREYHCRWIVKGHPRLQACGPGRKDRKLIWIEAHPAGPEDKPLRTREKVYAVIR